jgi:hypothetical protein
VTTEVIRTKDQLPLVMRRAWKALEQVLDKGVPVEVSVRVHKRRKTSSQRNTVHLWFDEIAQQTGHTAAEIKEILCQEFLGSVETEIVSPKTGEVMVRSRRRSTEGLNRQEYSELMDRVWAWAGEHGFVLTQPDPDVMKRWRAA